MRDLTSDDLGLLLSLFAVLLISFAIDFGFSKRSARRHRKPVLIFGLVALVGEFTAALTMVLCWVALWSPAAWEQISTLLVFCSGSISILCAVILTLEKGLSRLEALRQPRRTHSSEPRGRAVRDPRLR